MRVGWLLDSRQAGHWRASTLSLPSRSAAIPSELWLRKRFSKEQTHHAAWFNGTAGAVLPFRCANFSGWFTPRSDGRRPRSTWNLVPSPFIKPYARTRSRASDATDLSCLACVLAHSSAVVACSFLDHKQGCVRALQSRLVVLHRLCILCLTLCSKQRGSSRVVVLIECHLSAIGRII